MNTGAHSVFRLATMLHVEVYSSSEAHTLRNEQVNWPTQLPDIGILLALLTEGSTIVSFQCFRLLDAEKNGAIGEYCLDRRLQSFCWLNISICLKRAKPRNRQPAMQEPAN